LVGYFVLHAKMYRTY